MSTDLRIPVTSEQEKLILEAASQEPEGMTTWARTILLQAARDQIARRDNPPEVTADQAFLEEFQALADQWRRETDMHSSITKKTQHPAYRKIIDMGENALPWILRELRDRPGYWFETLRIISKQTPVSEAERSDPKKVREAWLKWGQKKGFLG